MNYLIYISWIVSCIISQKFGYKVEKSSGFVETLRIDWIGHFLSSLCFQYCLQWEREREGGYCMCVWERIGHFISSLGFQYCLNWERSKNGS